MTGLVLPFVCVRHKVTTVIVQGQSIIPELDYNRGVI
jgi:hypothetical protein